jgi:hypothetical protein
MVGVGWEEAVVVYSLQVAVFLVFLVVYRA